MQALLTRGLVATAPLWPDIRLAYGWVHRAAHLLTNDAGHPAAEVRRAYGELLGEMADGQAAAGALAPAVAHFLKVTDSYRPGLFHCYEVPGLPRTNNDLEQYFGSARYHQRRATVVRGRRARGRRGGHAPAQLRGGGDPSRQPGPMAAVAARPRLPPRGPPGPTALPPRPDGLPRCARRPPPQAEFAALEYTYIPGGGGGSGGGAGAVGGGRIYVSTPNGRIISVPDTWVGRPADNGQGIV